MKKLVSVFLVLCICVALSLPAFAVFTEPAVPETATAEESVARVEETQWRLRIYNGQPQKRLWSITKGIWLTDWMPADAPYP